ncbi:MAG TPA: CDP-alcohol phosphatidyltransferase family protein [Thermoanaerobaculia bacterium]
MNDGPTLALVAPEGAAGVPPETVLLGLPIIRRTVLSARRAGFGRILVVGATEGIRTALEGTPAELTTTVPPDAVSLEWNVAVETKDLQGLLAGERTAGVPVASRSDLPRAERSLLRGLIKDTEGFMSRHFERKISLSVSRLLAATRVTPNQMTLISVAIGLCGAPFFFSSQPAMQTAGALLFLSHSILDGCDGELARLKFQESRRGGLLDFWGDNVVHVAVFSAIAIGWSRISDDAWPLLCGAAAVAGTLLSATVVYRQTMAEPKEGPLFVSVAKSGESRLSRVADALSRRDFIYLVLILSAFGKAHWFLVLAAVGAPIFFFVLVGIAAGERAGSVS